MWDKLSEKLMKKRLPDLGIVGKIALLPVFFLGVAFAAMTICWHRVDDRETMAARIVAQADKSLLAEGVVVEESIGGRIALSVQIKTVRLASKQKGFLRLGFCKVLSCEGMTIDVYPPVTGRILRRELSYPLAGGGAGTTLSPVEHGKQSAAVGRAAPDDRYGGNFLSRKLALSCGVSPRTVKGLEMKNSILLRLHDQGQVILSLQSKRADFDSRRKSIVFEDAVRVVSQDGKMLETGRLEWFMKKGVLQTRHPYTFINDGQQKQGTCFTADLSLRPLPAAVPAKMKRKET
jgi:hypothetical protein